MHDSFGVTFFEKADGPLTKSIELVDGELKTDSSNCKMSHGHAFRWTMRDIGDLADEIPKFKSRNALSLGSLRPDLPDQVEIVVKRLVNGDGRIARTGENIIFPPGKPALSLLDFDTKSMPPEIAERLKQLGGFEAAIMQLVPELRRAARLFRASTSAGVYRSDTNEALPGSAGVHGLALIGDGNDNERFLATLHQRCWLAGLGWLVVSESGQILDRSIVDRVVWRPERLVFEGKPVLKAPLAQDAEARRPRVSDGGPLDTIGACRPLTVAESAKLADLKAREKKRLEGESARVKAKYVDSRANQLAKRTGATVTAARRIIEQQTQGVLLPDIILPFDGPELDGTTVAEVLEHPDDYVGETLADPLEGVGYGAGKAKIMRRSDGSLWIHSFAHGRSVYDLKLDYAAIAAELKAAAKDDLDSIFVKHSLTASLDAGEIDRLAHQVHKRSGTGLRSLSAMLRDAGKRLADEQRAEQFERRRAAEPRFTTEVPLPDEEFEPQNQQLEGVLKECAWPEPPARGGTENRMSYVRHWRFVSLHTLTREKDDSDQPRTDTIAAAGDAGTGRND